MLWGGHRRSGPPSADGTGWVLAAKKVPIITAVRIVIFATSFAFFIVVFLWDLGNSCSDLTVASALLESTSSAKAAHLRFGPSNPRIGAK